MSTPEMRSMPFPFRGNYVGGRFIRSSKGTELISEDPGDLLDPVGNLFFSEEAVDSAVAQAQKAFPAWSGFPLKKRIQKLRLFQQALRRNFPLWKSWLPVKPANPLENPVGRWNGWWAKWMRWWISG